MKWIDVDSSAICALAYDSRQRWLGVEFREKQQVYFYYGIPPSEFEAFPAAESKGRYLTQVFLPKSYDFTGPHLSRRHAA